MEPSHDYAQVEVSPSDTIEDVARRLVASAPASTIYDGVELRAEVGQDHEDVVRKYIRFRQTTDVRKRINQFAVSMVEVVGAESPGPGGGDRPVAGDQGPAAARTRAWHESVRCGSD